MQTLTRLAVSFLALLATAKADETWSISELSTHYMGSNSGLPGGQWPPASKFNTTIDFTVKRDIEDQATTQLYKCVASFDPDVVPKSWIPCDNGGLVWRLRTASQTSGANFIVEMLLGEIVRQPTAEETSAKIALSFSTVHITANDKSIPTSYMTCMSGAPLTGITCGFNVNNVQMGLGGPIVLNMETAWEESAPFLIKNINMTTTHQDQGDARCRESSSFTVYRADQTTMVQNCKGIWQCGTLTNNGLAGFKPPQINTAKSCTDGLPYDWYTSGAKSSQDMTVNVRLSLCQGTLSKSLDGTPVWANGRFTGSLPVSVGNQLTGGCTGVAGPCEWESPAGTSYPAYVTGFEFLADEGCGPAKQ